MLIFQVLAPEAEVYGVHCKEVLHRPWTAIDVVQICTINTSYASRKGRSWLMSWWYDVLLKLNVVKFNNTHKASWNAMSLPESKAFGDVSSSNSALPMSSAKDFTTADTRSVSAPTHDFMSHKTASAAAGFKTYWTHPYD